MAAGAGIGAMMGEAKGVDLDIWRTIICIVAAALD